MSQLTNGAKVVYNRSRWPTHSCK